MTANYEISISILEDNSRYRVVVGTEDDGDFIFHLPFDKNGFDNINAQIKSVLSEIIHESEYSNNIDISDERCKHDLWKIASLDLFTQIFLGYKPEPDAKQFVKLVKEHSQEHILKVKIVSENFFIPWALFYDGKVSQNEEDVNPESFWGFKHQISFNPAPGKRWKYKSSIDVTNFNFSFNANEDIDKDFEMSHIKQQNKFLEKISYPNFTKTYRSDKNTLLNAFKQDNFNDSLIYFFCHAEIIPKPVANSFIQLTGGEQITLHDLKTFCGDENFSKEPLVFLNACGSAEMNPLFYDGFLPYFMSKGSRGMIGTISKISALFASEFATGFFDKFLNGERLGEIMPTLRKKFLEQHNNPLGLFYQSYCNSNVKLSESILN